MRRKGVSFHTADVADLIRPLFAHQTIESAVNHDKSAIRAVYCILHGDSRLTELRRADRVFSAMGRPDLMQLLEEV